MLDMNDRQSKSKAKHILVVQDRYASEWFKKLHDPSVLFSLYFWIKCSLHILRVLSIHPDPNEGLGTRLKKQYLKWLARPSSPKTWQMSQILRWVVIIKQFLSDPGPIIVLPCQQVETFVKIIIVIWKYHSCRMDLSKSKKHIGWLNQEFCFQRYMWRRLSSQLLQLLHTAQDQGPLNFVPTSSSLHLA